MVSALVETLTRAETDCRGVVHLFGGPFVTLAGRRIEVPEGSKRLLVFVALQSGWVGRRYAAASLWPMGHEARASRLRPRHGHSHDRFMLHGLRKSDDRMPSDA